MESRSEIHRSVEQLWTTGHRYWQDPSKEGIATGVSGMTAHTPRRNTEGRSWAQKDTPEVDVPFLLVGRGRVASRRGMGRTSSSEVPFVLSDVMSNLETSKCSHTA